MWTRINREQRKLEGRGERERGRAELFEEACDEGFSPPPRPRLHIFPPSPAKQPCPSLLSSFFSIVWVYNNVGYREGREQTV